MPFLHQQSTHNKARPNVVNQSGAVVGSGFDATGRGTGDGSPQRAQIEL